MQKNFIGLCLTILLLFSVSCEKDTEPVSSETQKINLFVIENMKSEYYWNNTLQEIDYKTEKSTFELFDKLLAASYDSELDRNIDEWSFITDDYQGLMNYFAGIEKTMGLSIRLFRYTNENENLIGFIEYVEHGSPAENANLTRGDMFFKIDEEQLTIHNYNQLLDQDDFSITLGAFTPNFGLTRTAPSIQLSAVELQIDPIHLSKVIEFGGKKIGYLMYNSFNKEYDDDLETVFADFKSQGVTELVLDLRYNSGGSINSAILLSSMIAPVSAIGDTLIKSKYNASLEEYLKTNYPDDEAFFVDRLKSNPNNLNLKRLVVLSTYHTASASEMIIYGLSPYMEVYHIGEQTVGKYYGSVTISDPDEEHNWAIQPIIVKSENKDNSIDYKQGLIPDLERIDFVDAEEFYPLGDTREDFLAQALYYLTGKMPVKSGIKRAKRNLVPVNNEGKLVNQLDYTMYYSTFNSK